MRHLSMSEETVTVPSLSAKAEAVICSGDLKNLTDEEKVLWYKMRCHAAGLDYTTEPFQYIILNGKLKLYATKTATEQIAEKRAITLQIVGRESVGDAYVVTCRATDPTGRFTESIGAVSTKGKAGDEFCNMLMKAETKSKRRAVLSLTGLGMLDESEVDDIPSTPRPAPIEPSHFPALPPPPQEETAQKPQSETAASAKACFQEKARNLGYSGHIGQLAVMLLGHKPDKWTAQTWLDATEKTATEWDAALLMLREPDETQPQADPVDARASREEALIAGLQAFFGAQRLEEGIQKVSALLRRDILSYAEIANISDVELGRLEKWLADAKLNEGAKAA